MKIPEDNQTLELIEPAKKGRGRPKKASTKTGKQRKQEQLERDWTMVMASENEGGKDDTEWPERVCLMVINSTRVTHRSPLDKAAWIQLGKLRGFI